MNSKAKEVLRQSEERYRSILRTAMDGFWMIDLEGRLLEVNDAYCRMSGYSEPELLAMRVPDLSVHETEELAAAHIARIVELGVDRFETRHRRKDGSTIDIEVSAQYRTFEGGRVIVFLRDITELKQAEKELRKMQELYEDLVTALPAGAYRLRVKTHGAWRAETWQAMAKAQYSLDFASDRFCDILGIAHDLLAANPGAVSDVIHPDDKEDFDARNAQAMTDFNVFIWEGRIISNSRTRWVHFESLPRMLDPETVLWTGIVYDITGLKQAEKEREQFFKFFQTSADLMCLADPYGCFLKTNPAFTETLGYSEAELLAKPIVEFIHPDDRQATVDEIARQQRTGFTSDFRNRYLCRDGSVKWLSWRVRYNKNDGIAYATARDITDKKIAEEALQESEERMSLAMQAGNMGLFDLNVQTGEAVVNPEYALMLGYDPTEFHETNARWIERLHPEDREPVAAIYQAYVRGEIPHYRVEFRQETADGGWKWILSYGRIMEWDADGNPRRMLGVHVDISERKQAEESLRASRNLLRSILENVPIRVFWKDAESRYLGCNTAFARDAGYAHPEELLGKDDFQMCWRGQAELYRADDKRVMDSGTPEIGIEEPQTTPDGRIVCLRTSKVPLRDAENRVIGVLGIYEDISERKQAEETLREREEQLRVIFETSQAGIVLVDPQGTIRFANSRMAEMFGMPLGQLIGSSYPEHLHETERQAGDGLMRQLIRGDIQSVAVERRYLRADGSDFWGFLSGKRMESPDGTLQALVGIIADITERKRAEEALRESENRLRFALEGTNDGLWDVQMKTGTTYLSPRGREILGYQPDEAGEIADAWGDLVHPDDLPLTSERLRAHIEGRAPIFEVEQRLRMKSGDWKWVLARGKVVSRDEDGVPLRMTGTHTDLTEQKKLQEQLSQAQKMESVGRLAGGVAHDFNNMLNVIIGHAELARMKEEISPALHHHLEQIHKAAERSAAIVNQLLAFARKQTITPRVLDLNESVGSVLKMLRRLIGEDIDLALLPAEGLWPVRMDPAQIDQILANLCVNARDAIADIGRITIETGNVTVDAAFCTGHKGISPGEYVLLTVSDDGSGMDRETLTKIFDPFFTTKGVGQGTGLGLSTVYGIVKQNDGFIDVSSEPGHGTTFGIYLPRYLGKEELADAAGPQEPAGRGRETILLVEDEPAILDVGKQMLEMQGYRVLTAGTPGEALRLAGEQIGEIDLLITDVVMPEMNGRELARKILSLYPGLKRLFMSGYTADVIAHHGVLDEGVNFIQKPFSHAALTAKVREVLDQ